MSGTSFDDGGNIEKVEKKVERRKASDLSQNEVAEMFFDMMVNHRIMESRIEKLETRLNTVLSNNFIKKDVVPYHE